MLKFGSHVQTVSVLSSESEALLFGVSFSEPDDVSAFSPQADAEKTIRQVSRTVIIFLFNVKPPFLQEI